MLTRNPIIPTVRKATAPAMLSGLRGDVVQSRAEPSISAATRIPRTQHDLFYWENTAEGTRSEVDYIIARDLKVLPIECKAGTSGKMKSLYEFMRQKHLTEAIRSSLENFSELEYIDKKDKDAVRHVQILPLFAISNLFGE